MRLLFDQNLSPDLCISLSDCYPESLHVRSCGLAAAPDTEIWAFALREGLAIITKDSDFRQRSFLMGAPPKVLWIGLGNCSTTRIEAALREHVLEIRAFLAEESSAFLVLS